MNNKRNIEDISKKGSEESFLHGDSFSLTIGSGREAE